MILFNDENYYKIAKERIEKASLVEQREKK